MAKTTSTLVKVHGTFNGVTYVNSSAYAPHIRRPRGSVKPAKLNTTLASRADQTAAVNRLAKTIYDTVKEVAGTFRERNLWRRLLSQLQKLANRPLAEQLASLSGIEINNNYRLHTKVSFSTPVVQLMEEQVTVDIRFSGHAHFPKSVSADCYCYSLYLLWLDARRIQVDADSINTDWIHFSEVVPSLAFLFSKPSQASHLVLFLHVQGGKERKALEQVAAEGMTILHTQTF